MVHSLYILYHNSNQLHYMTDMTQITNSILPNNLTLYYSESCPFCLRVLNALSELGYAIDIKTGKAGDITLKNRNKDKQALAELLQGGGKKTVPCLRIERENNTQWMYESLDIIDFLKNKVQH